MKKLLILTVLAFAAFMLVGCGGSSSSSSEDLKSMYKDIWEEGIRIDDEGDGNYLVWKGTKDGRGKIIYEYDKETQKETPLFCIYSDWDGVYYRLYSEKKEGYVKVIDFYRNEWEICKNIKGSLEEANYKEGYCLVKAQRETETAYYLYDMYSGFINEYTPDLKMKIIIIKDPEFIKKMLEIIYNIKKKHN